MVDEACKLVAQDQIRLQPLCAWSPTAIPDSKLDFGSDSRPDHLVQLLYISMNSPMYPSCQRRSHQNKKTSTFRANALRQPKFSIRRRKVSHCYRTESESPFLRTPAMRLSPTTA
jgi:hypothetical protein